MGSAYILPKDASETERLEAQHALMKLAFGDNILAPVIAPRSILSVACGTGIWEREVAFQFPKADVVGFDYDVTPLKALQVQLGRKHQWPRNFHYQEANALEPFPFPDARFDLVHGRFMATWLPKEKWPAVVAEMVRVCRPGGWVQLVEGSLPHSNHAGYVHLADTLARLVAARGLDVQSALKLHVHLLSAGVQATQQREVQTGAAPEQQTLLFETTLLGFKNLFPLLQQHLSPDDYAAYQAALAQVERDRPMVTRLDVAAWGQKPIHLDG